MEPRVAAAPRAVFQVEGRPWSVRSFYRIWASLPYCRHAMLGSGVYALSEQGRKRFGLFPSITADDEFVRLQFQAHEHEIVSDCSFIIQTPATLSDVIRIKTRTHFGNHELHRQHFVRCDEKKSGHLGALLRLMHRPTLWPALAVYVYVRLIARLAGYNRYYFGNHAYWERDDSCAAGPN